MGKQGVLTTSIVLTIFAALLAVPGAATAKPPANEPCTKEKSYGWQGDWETRKVNIPALANPDGVDAYKGIIRRPRNLIEYPGTRPVVFLQHGAGGGGCTLSWLARDLAGHGYVTVTWATPKAKKNGSDFANEADSVRSAVSWARGPSNPFASVTNTGKSAIAGFSLGAEVTSLLQGEGALGTDAVIALDNLVRYSSGDDGSGSGTCDENPTFEVIPSVPALGLARDGGCKGITPLPAQKLSGFLAWRTEKVPSMQLTLAGFKHNDFAANGSKARYRLLSYYSEAWLQRWLGDDKSAVQQLLAKSVLGRPTAEVLSTSFFSGAYLPGIVNVTDYRDYIQRDHSRPETKKTGGPDNGKRVKAKKLKRTGIYFRFRASEAATYECRLDRGKWNRCDAPKKLERKLPKGKHSFRVRATDLAGNREAKPAKWKFRVVK